MKSPAHPSDTKDPVVAPLWAVLIQGVPDTRDAIFPVSAEPQKPFPHPPLFGVVLVKKTINNLKLVVESG